MYVSYGIQFGYYNKLVGELINDKCKKNIFWPVFFSVFSEIFNSLRNNLNCNGFNTF